jgi:monofunctional biosynthetic peptidoglycan transglycosylase
MAVGAASGARKRVKRRAGGRKHHPWLRRVALALLVLAGAVLLSIVAFRFVNPPITTVMAVEKLSGATLKRRWVPLEKISRNLRLAVVSSEDGNFCTHWGVDWAAVSDAIDQAQSLKGVRGASTIAMQTAKNLYLWNQRNYLRKAIEVPLAYLMTAIWPKPRMMEVYLNIAQWGPGVFGAEAASRYYFRKPASRLTKREAVLLAVALPNPRRRNPAKPSRRMRLIADTIERRMPYMTKRASCVLKP